MGTLVLAVLGTFALAVAFVRALSDDRLAGLVLDIPNDRSLHVRPTPRTGGVGLIAAVAIVLLLARAGPAAIVVPALALAALFFLDDIRGLAVGTRFAAQFAAAAVFLWADGPYHWLLWPLLAVGIVWSTNLYNFMDGSNGLAGGMAVIGFGAYAIAANAAGAPDLALLAAIVAAAAAGFLLWNFDPARIFLGDAGSIPLGFLAAVIGVAGWRRGLWPFWFPALVFSVFIVDSGLTLVKRILHRENPFQAHRSHYYQRLIRMGWSHCRLALNAYALMVLTAASALLLREASAVVAVLGLAVCAAAFVLVVIAVDGRWRQSDARREALERRA